MPVQLMSDAEALRLFFTEDIYLIPNDVCSAAPVLQDQPLLKVPEVISAPLKITPVPAENPEERFNFIGGNGRKVLVVMNDPVHPEGNPAEMAFLWRILGAIKLTVNDCAVMNRDPYPKADFVALANFFHPQAILFFGINPVNLGLPFQENSDLKHHNGVHIICSPALDAIEENIALKTLLWKSLQQLTLS